MDGAIEASLGITGKELYEEWKKEKIIQYKPLADSLHSMRTDEEIIESEGFWNFYPVFSPDGASIAYISNKGMDYYSLTSVYLYDRAKKKSKMIIPT